MPWSISSSVMMQKAGSAVMLPVLCQPRLVTQSLESPALCKLHIMLFTYTDPFGVSDYRREVKALQICLGGKKHMAIALFVFPSPFTF